MSQNTLKPFFIVAAVFNITVAATLLFATGLFMEVFQLVDYPTQPIFVHLVGGLVFVFGIGYYIVAQNPAGNKPIIQLGIIGKLLVFVITFLDTLLGTVNWPIMIPSSIDFVFAIFFYKAIKVLDQHDSAIINTSIT